LPLVRQARSQAQLKIAWRGDRLEAADQFAQSDSLSAKVATRRARCDMQSRWIAQRLIQF
jgi:hypothetical protein